MYKQLSSTIPALRRMAHETGTRGIRAILCGVYFAALIFMALPSFAQYSANIQGTVQDPSGAAVNGAHLRLTNASTGVESSTVSNATGGYRFLSLAPGRYTLEAQAEKFAKSSFSFTLETDQTMEVPVKLAVASASVTVSVTSQVPILDTAESRNQLTIETDAMSELPLPSRNLVSLVNMAPGMVGIGLVAGNTPGSGADNYSTETQVDTSANGQGPMGNLYVVDGLDVTSAIRPGVLNLTPNSDTVQEASVQVNTYTVDYGRASSVQMVMTTKAGGDRYHGSASELYNSQQMWAHNQYQAYKYAPFHGNNLSGTVGGPIWPHHQAFFFFAIEPLRSAKSAGGGTVQFEDPQFVSWAETNNPSTIGTSVLKDFPVSAVNPTVYKTADAYFSSNPGAGLCGPTASGGNGVPCSMPVIDQAGFNATSFRNAIQWNGRLDKVFKNDRVYGNFFRGNLTTGSPNPRPDFTQTQKYWTLAWQGNETHTFSSNTINQAIVGGMRVEGVLPASGDFKVPVINVGGLGSNFGDGFALGDFIQHNYHWRDVLTHIHGSHTFTAGIEGWFGDDVELFSGPYDLPTFYFANILTLVQDNPVNEGGVAYNPITGQHVEYNWNAASRNYGAFAEDTWKVRKNLTLNYGLRWDDFGNPYSRTPTTVFANFYMGGGLNLNQQVANGILRQTTHALAHSITDVMSPRLGFSWDIASNGQWVLHGGAGIFHNWPTMANEQEEFRGNPPGAIFPTFNTGSAHAPLFGLGTSDTPPFGYTYPTLAAGALTPAGGITGLEFGVGGIDPTLKSPVAYIYSGQLEHPLTRVFVASVGFSGANSRNQLSAGGNPGNVAYGVDINTVPGDLYANEFTNPTNTNYCGGVCSVTPERLNQNFGSIYYTQNDRHSNYAAMFVDMRARFNSGAFFDVSYTRSESKDNTQYYPTWQNQQAFYGPSNWDAPNRLSATANYTYKGVNHGEGMVGRATGGWGVSSMVIAQSGYPFTVANYNAFHPTCGTAAAPYSVVCAPGVAWTGNDGGDYNADGSAYDFPNVSSYTQTKGRKNWLVTNSGTGTIASSQISGVAFGTAQEGNETVNGFRGPSFFEANASLMKDTTILHSVQMQFRLDVFNLFQNSNLNNVDTNINDGTNFGKALNALEPRWMQVGIGFKF